MGKGMAANPDTGKQPGHPARHSPEQSPKRPTSVTWLLFGVLIIALTYWVRFFQALSQWEFLSMLPGVSPMYQALTGLLWGLASVPVAVGLWRGWSFGWRLLPYFALAFALYYWLDLLLAAQVLSSSVKSTNFLFRVLATLLLLLFTFWTYTRPKSKAFFRSRS